MASSEKLSEEDLAVAADATAREKTPFRKTQYTIRIRIFVE